jgi:hypothetical protein
MTESATFSVFGSLPIGGGSGGLSESQVQAIAQVEVGRAIKRQKLMSAGDDTLENGYKLITAGSLPLALRTLRTGEGISLSTVTSPSDTVGSVVVSASEDLLAYGTRFDELEDRLQGVEVWGSQEEGGDNRLTQVEARMDVVEGVAASKANQDEVTEIGAEIFASPPYREGVRYRLAALETKVNLTWNIRGEYDGGTEYAVGDVVYYLGSSFYRSGNPGNVGFIPEEGKITESWTPFCTGPEGKQARRTWSTG